MPGYDDELLGEIRLLGELVELASTAQTIGPEEVDGALGLSAAAETERGAHVP